MSLETTPILHGVIEIVSAHLANNSVAVSEVPAFIRNVHATLTELEGNSEIRPASADPVMVAVHDERTLMPAVPIDQSVTNDYLICLEDGKHLRMLKRYLGRQFGLTPEQYRAKWGLPADYPMVAPAVTEQRRGDAINRGFGRRPEKAKSRKARARK